LQQEILDSNLKVPPGISPSAVFARIKPDQRQAEDDFTAAESGLDTIDPEETSRSRNG